MFTKPAVKLRATFYTLTLTGIACLAAAFATLGKVDLAAYILFGCAGATLLAQAVICLALTRKQGAFTQWVAACEVIVLTTLIVALLPLALVMWIVELLCDARGKKK